MPISYWIDEKGLAQLGNGSEFEAIQASFRSWENVPSANVRFIYRGARRLAASIAMARMSFHLRIRQRLWVHRPLPLRSPSIEAKSEATTSLVE